MRFETKLTPVRIGLTEMLDALWEEIQKAATEAQKRGVAPFVFEEAEVEVAVEIEAKAESKFSLHVVEFGAGLTGTRTATVRIKLKQYTEELAKKAEGRWVFLAEKNPVKDAGGETERPVSKEAARELAERRLRGGK